jgi:hypothetical protein
MPKPAAAKKVSDQDLTFARMATAATLFTAVLHMGPGTRERVEADSFVGAVDAGKALELANPANIRRTVIYAVGPRGESIPIDTDIARLAGYPEEAIERMNRRAKA